MSWVYLATLVACIVASLFVGFWIGRKTERRAWLDRGDGTPREVDGQRYYVIPDNEYCRTCQVQRALTEEGRCATLEYRQRKDQAKT